MKARRFHLSLYIIVPLIFAGLAFFAVIITYNITARLGGQGFDPWQMVVFIGVCLAGISCLLAMILLRIILSPVQEFIKSTESMPLLVDSSTDESSAKGLDDIKKMAHVFKQVTNALSKVDAAQHFPEIVGESPAIRSALTMIMKVASSDASVLILGESGTGKELAAEAIHRKSSRRDQPLIKINCAAIPAGLMESELFGHEKGAFTGAVRSKPGKLEMADQGSIFLDEIGDMPLELQAKILRVFHDSEFERVGGTRTIKVKVRLIAATHQDLEEMVKDGSFREDLYYRLNVFSILMPPLRSRIEDIPILAKSFLKNAPRPVRVSQAAEQLLMFHTWPGNIRELKNVIARSMILCEDDIILPEHLPSDLDRNGGIATAGNLPSFEEAGESLDDVIGNMERDLILAALHKTGGVQVKAAELLGINQRSLWHRIKKHKIDVKSIKTTFGGA